MRKTAIFCCLMFLIPATAYRASAQDASKPPEPTPHYYHLDFVVQETGDDGKPVNSRSYSTTVSTEDRKSGSIRTGSKIPIFTGGEKQDVQYMDVGVNIDTRSAREIGRQLSLDLTADVSSLATTNPQGFSAHPVVRQNRWQSMVLIPISKSALVFSSDNLENKGKIQLLVTATPLQ